MSAPALILIQTSARGFVASQLTTVALARCLAAGATASSRSTISASAPQPGAFASRSG